MVLSKSAAALMNSSYTARHYSMAQVAMPEVPIPTPFHSFCFLVLRPGEAGAQHQKKKFGDGEAAPNPHFVEVFSRI